MLLNIDSGNGLAPSHGPLARYVKSRIAHAPGMPGTFSPPPRVSDPGMRHGTCVTHVPWCMRGSLTSGFLWSRWWEKSSRHSRRMHNPQFYVSGKRPITWTNADLLSVSPEEHISMKFHMKFKFFTQEYLFESVVPKISAIVLMPRFANTQSAMSTSLSRKREFQYKISRNLVISKHSFLLVISLSRPLQKSTNNLWSHEILRDLGVSFVAP